MKINKNNLEDVFKAKRCDQETLELKGYQLAKDFFVDNSGFGMASELALTKDSFFQELKTFIGNDTYYAFITGAGQFQVYLSLFTKDGEKRAKTVASNTLKIQTENGYIIRLYETDIIEVNGRTLTINNGGYQTSTTKRRINQFLPIGRVYQKNYDWFFEVDGKEPIEFENGKIIYES